MEAASTLIDRECLADLSMRKLGADLGVEAMSLYRYFPSKADLLDAVVERAARDLELPSSDLDWREALRRFARSFRRVALRHPAIAPLLAAAPPRPAMRLATQTVATVLASAGFPTAAVPQAQCAVLGYLIGSTAWLADEAGPGAIDREAAFEFGLDALLSGLDASRQTAS